VGEAGGLDAGDTDGEGLGRPGPDAAGDGDVVGVGDRVGEGLLSRGVWVGLGEAVSVGAGPESVEDPVAPVEGVGGRTSR